ncbi:winged helix-turn-helix transcriptional regulator [Actinomadura parmotrematis]|uniref:Helix-turn-helix transcriptional regulator n=1 Tax=Actinomadura parmotrematis TaxID=2864039 RepID=A0ABS7FR78_9ACTN|nr:helix-turn-helix domain-containing protein [Actinomadura parmotrematis]MBW8482894.1 helix-turn-helix transcriptional regulator [Actinomadura parmotrematis]
MTTMSAAQRRAAAKAAHTAYLDGCPTGQLLELLGGKWTPLLLFALADGPRRYGDLARAVPGASAKMLTQTLRGLERDGFVERTVTPAVPARVDYALTGLGRRLLPLLDAVRAWADDNLPDVHAARARHGSGAG